MFMTISKVATRIFNNLELFIDLLANILFCEKHKGTIMSLYDPG